MARLVLVLALAASLASGCVRPIFDGRSVSSNASTAAATAPAYDPQTDPHTLAFGI